MTPAQKKTVQLLHRYGYLVHTELQRLWVTEPVKRKHAKPRHNMTIGYIEPSGRMVFYGYLKPMEELRLRAWLRKRHGI